MTRFFLPVLMLTCITTAGCDGRFFPINREAEVERALKALLRHEILGNQTFENYQPVFLTIDGEDPSAEFLKSFERSKTPVKKGSEAGQEGFRYSIDSWEWIANDELEVITSHHCGLKCGGGSRFHLVRMNDSWMVKDKQGIWAE